jgi:hypothetical protein
MILLTFNQTLREWTIKLMQQNGRHWIKKCFDGLGRVSLLHVDPAELAATKESRFVTLPAKNG